MGIQDLLFQKRKTEEREKIGKGKVVFITGSSVGIGRETALTFARAGWKIIISYFTGEEEASETAKRCDELGAQETLVVKLNVADNSSILQAVKEIIKKFDKIDVLVNNAGIAIWKELKEQSDEEIEAQIMTNLEGLIKVTKYCLPYIRECILNIASGAGKMGFADLTVYCATKFGVRGFSQALSQELVNIKVYSINPGTTATRMTDNRGASPAKVSEVIFNAAVGKYDVPSGSDIDVWKIL